MDLSNLIFVFQVNLSNLTFTFQVDLSNLIFTFQVDLLNPTFTFQVDLSNLTFTFQEDLSNLNFTFQWIFQTSISLFKWTFQLSGAQSHEGCKTPRLWHRHSQVQFRRPVPGELLRRGNPHCTSLSTTGTNYRRAHVGCCWHWTLRGLPMMKFPGPCNTLILSPNVLIVFVFVSPAPDTTRRTVWPTGGARTSSVPTASACLTSTA